MKYLRLVIVSLIGVVVAAVAAAVPGTSAPQRLAPAIEMVPTADVRNANSTWMCAAPALPAEGPTAHVVVLTNRSDSALGALLTGHGEDASTSEATITVPARTTQEVDATATLGAGRAVFVDAPGGDLVVSHRLTAGALAAQQQCVTGASDTWHFPVASTARGTSTRLAVFNPFRADATLDIAVATDAGVRTPGELSGVPVSPGTVKIIDLGASVQRRDQFSFTVRLRTGRVAAELVQVSGTAADSGTVILQPGSPMPVTRSVLADGYVGPGVDERLVVFNPGEAAAEVVVQALPFAVLPVDLPEPFKVSVPAGRYSVLEMAKETRIPTDRSHALVIESSNGVPVVAGRVQVLSAAGLPDAAGAEVPVAPIDPAKPARPAARGGAATMLASPVAARRWIVPAVVVGPEQPELLVLNPGDGTAVVKVSRIAPDGITPIDGAARELPPGTLLSLPVATAGAPGRLALLVESAAPVVVELRQPLAGGRQFSTVAAVPEREGLVPAPSPLAVLLAESTAGGHSGGATSTTAAPTSAPETTTTAAPPTTVAPDTTTTAAPATTAAPETTTTAAPTTAAPTTAAPAPAAP